jgi:Protein of unknown function (DUF3617)
MSFKQVLSAGVMLLAVGVATAQTQASGLWEHSMTMKSQSGEVAKALDDMQAKLAAMPPEQRQQIEQMMASRGVTLGNHSVTTKVCISKEQAARAAQPRLSGDCTMQDLQRSGSSMSFKYQCTKPRPMSGEGQWSFNGDKAYTGKLTTTSTQSDGKPQEMIMQMTGKWVSADCGDVQPVDLPAK